MSAEKQNIRMADVWNWIQVFLICYGVFFLIDYLAGVRQGCAWRSAMLFAPACGFFLVKEKCVRLWSYLLGNGIFSLICVLLGRDWKERWIYGIYAGIFCCISWVRRKKEREKVFPENLGIWFLLILLPLVLIAWIAKAETFVYEVCVWIVLLFFWVHYINIYSTNQERYFLKNNETTKILEKKDMRHAGKKAMCVFGSMGMLLLCIGGNVYKGNLLQDILGVIYRFLQWIFHFLPGEAEEPVLVPKETHPPFETTQSYDGDISYPLWLQKLLNALQYVGERILDLLVVLFVLGIIILVCYLIRSAFYGTPRRKKDEKNYSGVIKTEEKIVRNKKKTHREWKLRRNNNEKVRKLFGQYIRQYEEDSKIAKKQKTATELKDLVQEERKSVAEKLLPYYHIARYSEKNITREELEYCKKMVKDVINM